MSTEPRTAVRHEVLGPEDAGQRVDKVLARLLPTVPRTRLFRLLRKGEVRLNGKRVAGDARVAAGDQLRLPPVREEPVVVAPAGRRVPAALVDRINAAVLYEDPRLLVIDKPAGVAVHGGSGISHGVIEALRAARPEEELELVHRLDRDTSGCLLVARRRSMLRSLHALLREEAEGEESGFEKRYLALLRGKWELGRKRIDVPLRTDLRVGGERTVKADANGKPAASEFRVVQFFGRLATLVEVRLYTGRTHQIRVHAAYAGHPVAGDGKYGDAAFNDQLRAFGLARMFLHAHSVGFIDPERQVDMNISAPLPPELKAVVDALAARAGNLKPAGAVSAGIVAAQMQAPPARPVRPRRPPSAAPGKARSAAGRSGRSGPASRSNRTKSRRGPRT